MGWKVLKRSVARKVNALVHFYAAITKRYYAEDFVRMYPNDILFDHRGRRIQAAPDDAKNFINHRKFYLFSAQFARGATVADVGCGSGYGCALLREAGAVRVCGIDASDHAIRFANEHFGSAAEFVVHAITDLGMYPDGLFDLVVCNEVLEHVKEFGKEDLAVNEMKRVAKPGATVVIGTPNSELLGDHGFSFEEIMALIKKHFNQFCIFENALEPFGASRELWRKRLSEGRTGVVVNQAINIDETVLPTGEIPFLKPGRPPGLYRVGDLKVDTTLLHNTHSWAIVALNNPVQSPRRC